MDKEQLIKKWLNDDLSETESEAFNLFEDAGLYKEIIEEAQRFNGTINAKVEPFDKLEKKLITDNKSSINWTRVISGIAAILVVGFALFTLLIDNETTTFYTDYAQNETITLPDNSIVNLNEFSQLEYNSKNWDENRTLNLKGEAFFDVEKGKRFEVNTKYGKVTVLGTEFNVLSRDSIFKVSCYEGLVEVIYNTDEVMLPAGTEFVLSSSKGLKSNITIAEPYWLQNMSVFENAAFKDVVEELEKQYNIKVHYPSDLKIRFTGAFEHNNLENALKSISIPLNMTYTIKNKKEVIIENEKN